MIGLLAFTAALAAAQPAAAPAWEPLACIHCEADAARASGWSYEAALADDTHRSWRDYVVPDALRGHRFATQRQCLRALRQALPAVQGAEDERGQITTREHRRDVISETQTLPGVQSASGLYGCFQHRTPTS